MNKFVLTAFLLSGAALTLTPPRNQPGDVECKVISVKLMSNGESAKIAGPDFIGADVLVRFRLATSSRAILFYGTNYDKKPVGHRTRWSSDGKMRVYPLDAKEPKDVSPALVI